MRLCARNMRRQRVLGICKCIMHSSRTIDQIIEMYVSNQSILYSRSVWQRRINRQNHSAISRYPHQTPKKPFCFSCASVRRTSHLSFKEQPSVYRSCWMNRWNSGWRWSVAHESNAQVKWFTAIGHQRSGGQRGGNWEICYSNMIPARHLSRSGWRWAFEMRPISNWRCVSLIYGLASCKWWVECPRRI